MIAIVDGNHLTHLFYHINPDPPDVVERLLIRLDNLRNWLLELCHKMNLSEPKCLIAFDNGKPTFRHKLFKAYKGTRTHDEGIVEAVIHAKEALKQADDWRRIIAPVGYEADDVMASVAAQASEPVLIHTADKDLHQSLVDGRVGIIKKSWADSIKTADGIHIESKFSTRQYTARMFVDEFGFEPSRWVDYQCLVGDSADNVKGADGIGHQTAVRILRAYDDIPLAELDTPMSLNRRQRVGFIAMQERLALLKDLFTLRTDLEVA